MKHSFKFFSLCVYVSLWNLGYFHRQLNVLLKTVKITNRHNFWVFFLRDKKVATLRSCQYLGNFLIAFYLLMILTFPFMPPVFLCSDLVFSTWRS